MAVRTFAAISKVREMRTGMYGRRESKWTASVAVGNKKFVGKVRENLGIRAAGRDIIESGASH